MGFSNVIPTCYSVRDRDATAEEACLF